MFSLSETTLGVVPTISTASISVTPLSIIRGAENEMDERVTNLLRLLYALDTDANPDNEIQIERKVRDAFSGKNLYSDARTVDFENDIDVQVLIGMATSLTSAGTRGLASAEVAQANFRKF